MSILRRFRENVDLMRRLSRLRESVVGMLYYTVSTIAGLFRNVSHQDSYLHKIITSSNFDQFTKLFNCHVQ